MSNIVDVIISNLDFTVDVSHYFKLLIRKIHLNNNSSRIKVVVVCLAAAIAAVTKSLITELASAAAANFYFEKTVYRYVAATSTARVTVLTMSLV